MLPDPASDWPTLLHTLDAEILCQGTNGSRTIPIKGFIEDSYTTILDHAELVTEIRFNVPPSSSGGAYLTFKKAAPAYPIAAAGVQLTLVDGLICQDVRLVLGCAGPKPVTSAEAESVLRGKELDEKNLKHAAEIIVESSEPRSDNNGSEVFKRTMLRSLLMKAVKTAVARSGKQQLAGGDSHV